MQRDILQNVLNDSLNHTQIISLNNAGRPLRTMFMLMLLLLLGVMPTYAQSESNAAADATTDSTSVLNQMALAIPALESPVPNTVSTALTDPPVGVPVLRWDAVPGAARYNVQISVSSGFASTVVDKNTAATSYAHDEVLGDGTYFWRVRADIDGSWGVFSEAWSFRKDWSAAGLVKPLLVAPADDPSGQQVITNFSPQHFSWEPVPGAAYYELVISTSPSFNDAKPYKATTLKSHHTPLTQLTNNQYYWRVTPYDSRDNAGEPSDVRTFVFAWNHIPELLTPADEIVTRFNPRFTWTAVPGASSYILEVSSQENFSDSQLEAKVTTKNTSYTLDKSLGNNKDYFWRVRAVSPQKVNGPASEVRRFRANWIQPPSLLSPPTRSINHIYPYFSWTPVAGAEKYQIQIATGNGFGNLVVDTELFNATSYSQPEWPEIIFGGDYFWRVRAKDAQGNSTNWSNEQTFWFSTTPPPNLIYPEPYYVPDAEGMPVHTERTIANPIFVWDTTHQWMSDVNGGNGPAAFVYPDFYRLEVATTSEFDTIVFSIDSAGQSAVPTLENPFNVIDKSRYFWRVTPFHDNAPMADGTIWETRIDRTLQQLPLDGDGKPDISHPQDGFIATGTAPILGWLPVANTHHYEVQISTNRDFSNIVDTASPLFPYYAPWQGRQTPMPPGAYWWRVIARDANNNQLGEWSDTRYFIVMGDLMTGNTYDYVIPEFGTLLSTGDPFTYDAGLSLVAQDTFTVSAPYNVGALHIVQDRSIDNTKRSWVIAFGTDDGVEGSLTYVLYFDVNQKEGVGGTTDPRGKPITTDPLYLPDYVIYLDRTNDTITDARFYEWNGNSWTASLLSGLGGTYGYDPLSRAVQVVFPYSMIVLENDDLFSGGIGITVYSTGNAATAGPLDSVPHQGATYTQPALVSNMPMLLFPFDTPLSNPIVYHELPTLRWRMPRYNSIDGYILEVARNADFTQETVVETWSSYESKTTSYYGAAPTAFHSGISYTDDESYYWRVRYRHERYDGANEYDVSPWSQPMRFKLTSYQPSNPTVTLGNSIAGEAAQATPSFTWDRVEGASRYSIQIDDDFNMNSPITNKTTDGNSFTALDTLADGTYYWRVAMRRSNNVLGQWTSVMSFTKTSLVPTLVGPINGEVVNNQPTFVWEATLANAGELHIAAPRYRLQWADNPQFSNPVEIVTEATSYTPVKGKSLHDGTWFWRVAVIDADNRRGPDTTAGTFYKEYLRPEVLSPVQGSSESTAPSFEWTPLDGAAYYKLEIDDNEAFDSPMRVTTDNTRYTPISKFAPGEYYWRVQMVDKDNKPGPTIAGRFTQGPESPYDEPSVFMPMVVVP